MGIHCLSYTEDEVLENREKACVCCTGRCSKAHQSVARLQRDLVAFCLAQTDNPTIQHAARVVGAHLSGEKIPSPSPRLVLASPRTPRNPVGFDQPLATVGSSTGPGTKKYRKRPRTPEDEEEDEDEHGEENDELESEEGKQYLFLLNVFLIGTGAAPLDKGKGKATMAPPTRRQPRRVVKNKRGRQ